MARTLRLASLFALVALALACGCNNTGVNTQVLLVVEAEPGVQSATYGLQLDVRSGPAGSTLEQLAPREQRTADGLHGAAWPRTLVLVPTDRDPTRVYQVTATALNMAGQPVASASAFSGYVAETTRVLRVWLRDRCIGVVCDPNSTCAPTGMCVEIAYQDPTLLPVRDADAGSTADGGMDAGPGPDGGLDGGPDAGDAGPRVDAGDGGAGDAATCDPARCDDGLACTLDRCGPTGCVHEANDVACEDGNVCTTDHCDAAATSGDGCVHAPNTVGCDDGTFCNGLDHCAGGTCSSHAGDPCVGLTCDEGMAACTGCDGSHPCPGPSVGTWSTCSYADPTCSEEGTHSRAVLTFACNGTTHACESTSSTETQACGARTTEGATCMADQCDPPGSCTYGGVCDPSGLMPRTCHQYQCHASICTDQPYSSPLMCSRSTEGQPCDDGNACTTPDQCMGGACTGTYACDTGGVDAGGVDSGVCDDGFDCTIDAMGRSGCMFTPDSSFCSYGGACATGMCDPTAPGHDAAGCVFTYACPDAGMGDTGRGRCVSMPFLCNFTADPCLMEVCDPLSPFADANGCVAVPVDCDGGTPP